MQQSELDFINSLRQATPYIDQHRGKTLVVYVPGEVIAQTETFRQVVQDLHLLHTLGLQMVLAAGATPQIDHALTQAGLQWETHQHQRITTEAMLPLLQQTIGQLRSDIEATFSCAVGRQLHTQPLTVLSGNWITARPKGVIEGIDYQHTGKLRKLQYPALKQTLNSGAIALLTPLAYSLTGEVFNLNTREQAIAVAHALGADKLMLYTPSDVIQNLPKQLRQNELAGFLKSATSDNAQLNDWLSPFTHPLNIKRVHLLDQAEPDALLYELFTLDGKGCLIFNDHYHQIRRATLDDVGGIIHLIAPLENQGVLVKRSRESLELEIEHFFVIERDQQIIGCAALYPHPSHRGLQGELACLAIDPAHRNQALGEQLLKTIEEEARHQGIQPLFLLTTVSQHWFIEHGFQPADPSVLPEAKKSLYNYQRQSKVLVKSL